jgi:TP901 family phage tail tape measure protein
MADKSFNLAVLFTLTDKLSGPMKRMHSRFKKTQQRMKGLMDVGKKMTTRLTLPLVGLSVLASRASMNFGKQMAGVSTLLDRGLGDVQERTAQLGKGVQKLSVDMGKSTDDMTDGLYQVVSAFGDTSENIDRLRVVSKGAVAGNASTVESLNLLSAVTKGYGDASIAAMTKASDLAFQTVKLGQTTFPELASSMGRVIPIASTLGVKQEELFGIFATLTGVTGNASEVSTQAAASLRALLKPSTELTKKVKSMGFESSTAMVKQLGLVETMNRLKDSVDGDEIALGKLFPRAEALTALFALTGAQAENFTNKMNAMTTAAGSTDEAFKRSTTGAGQAAFTWQKFSATLKVAAIQLGDALAPALMRILNIVMKVVGWFSGLSGTTKTIIVVVGLFVAALGPLVIMIGQLAIAMGALNLSMLPTFAIIIAIAAAIGGLIFLIKKFRKSRAEMKGDTVEMKENKTFTSAFPKVSDFGGEKSQADININVTGEKGATATVGSMRKRGSGTNLKLNTDNKGYGSTIPEYAR